MVQDCQEAFQVDDVMMEAVVLARCDQSAVITEWHLLMALLGDEAVRRQFNNEKGLEKQLADHAKADSKSCGNGTCKPKLSAKLQAAMDQVILHHRLKGVMDDSVSEDMTEALYNTGSDMLRMVMNHFGYQAGGRGYFDEDVARETDEEFFRRYMIGFMDQRFVSGRCFPAVAG